MINWTFVDIYFQFTEGQWTMDHLGQVWYLIVSIPDLCTLTYFEIGILCWHNAGFKFWFQKFRIFKILKVQLIHNSDF